MSTRRDTQKFRALLALPRVALLVHDFPDSHASRGDGGATMGKTFSITLYGSVREEQGTEAERLRNLHLERHGAAMRQFICGDDVAVISVVQNIHENPIGLPCDSECRPQMSCGAGSRQGENLQRPGQSNGVVVRDLTTVTWRRACTCSGCLQSTSGSEHLTS